MFSNIKVHRSWDLNAYYVHFTEGETEAQKARAVIMGPIKKWGAWDLSAAASTRGRIQGSGVKALC